MLVYFSRLIGSTCEFLGASDQGVNPLEYYMYIVVS